jgi:hypothetical protein
MYQETKGNLVNKHKGNKHSFGSFCDCGTGDMTFDVGLLNMVKDQINDKDTG